MAFSSAVVGPALLQRMDSPDDPSPPINWRPNMSPRREFVTSALLALTALVGCTDKQPEQSPVATDDDPPAEHTDEPTGFDCATIATPLADPPSFYEDNPTLIETGELPVFEVGSPESQGIDGEAIEAMAAAFGAKRFANSLLVMRHDVLVHEAYFNGAIAEDSNNVHSASKSLLGILTGAVIEDGLIESRQQPVSGLLPQLFTEASPEHQALTVEHLLTMSAGFAWREDVSEYTLEEEPDWLAAIVGLPLEDEAGTQFNYGTAQSHLLGASVAAATQSTLCDEAHSRILTPLGIEAERWGRDPQGYYSGGYNVYLTPRELLRFGQLLAHGGEWDGAQLVPKAWVNDALSEQIHDGGNWYYGYQFWLWRPNIADVDIVWGYGGQQVFFVPEQDLVVVFTTNTGDYDPNHDASSLVKEHLLPAIND
jgi:CubicO group peptidase (beta-lactamase class C family)